MKRKKAKKQVSNQSSFMAIFVFVSTATTALLSFISMEIAFAALGLFTLSALLIMEMRRRNFWEMAASFKLKTLEDEQKSQRRDIIHHEHELNTLKSDLRRLQQSTESAAPESNDSDRSEPQDQPPFTFLQALTQIEPFAPPRPQKRERILRAVSPQREPPEPAHSNPAEEQLSNTLVQELLRHALENRRVDVFVQPIVRLPQRQTRFYEVYARIRARPGQYLPATRYRAVAEQDNLMPEIDSLLLLHCLKTIQETAHLQKAAPFFINITGKTLKDLTFMKRLLSFLSKHRMLAQRLVFEMPQQEFSSLPGSLIEVMRGLGKLGCSFSLDHVTALDFDIPHLQSLKIRYIKLNFTHLKNATNEGRAYAALQKAKRKLEANAIGVIIEKIETEEHMRALLDYDIHYGQGYLFGKPDLQGAYATQTKVNTSGPTNARRTV